MIINPISYPGNKNKLLKEIIPLFPNNITDFVDVFCGSGVVGVNSAAQNIICNDNNPYTISVLSYFYENDFEFIINKVENIISQYGLTYSRIKEKGFYKEYKHEGLSLYNKSGFQKLKDDYNSDKDIAKLVVLLIYGFNHYLRFNKAGVFNVPVGKVDLSKSIYDNMKMFITDIKNKKLIFKNLDFSSSELYTDKDAFYYFDPPYLITTAPYNASWSVENEKSLYSIIDRLHIQGCKFALSNVVLSNGKENQMLMDWIKSHDEHYHLYRLKRQYRNANYQKVNITDSIEVLITNYKNN